MKSNKLIDKKTLLKPIIVSFIHSTSIIGFSLSMSAIIDNLGKKNFNQSKHFIFISLGILILQAIFYFIHIKVDNRWVKNRNIEIKNKLVTGWYEQMYENFLREQKLGINSFFLKDLDIIESDYLRSILDIITNLSLLTLSLISLLQIHKLFIILLVGLVLISSLVTITFSKKIEHSNNTYLERVKEMSDSLNEFANGFAIMKFFKLSGMVINKMKMKIDSQETARESRMNLAQVANGTIMKSTLLIHLIGYALGVWLIYKEQLSIGLMIASIELIGYSFEPIVSITGAFTQIKACDSIIKRIKSIMDSKNPKGKSIKGEIKRISVNDLSFTYEAAKKTTIDNFNMEFSMGKSYAIVGKNGSGKSTLLKILAGLYKTYKGTINIEDIEYKEISEKLIFDRVSYIPQSSFLFSGTLSENFNYNINEDVIDSLRDFNIDYINKYETITNLSGGELQKLSIIRALNKDADIIIADEPTSALDDESKTVFFNLLKNSEKLWIVVTHDSRELDKFDHVIDLNV
ncbi:ABC transporter ATP-binding protein [Peptoniphilus sp.]|uniref:ABC transporter ATP-binding protein n=1 Tax=Peptoniphilus sp. TaxID=1971214 RepID=UPI002A820FC0|nr:ABC transporter ATP-binding protein [Peptoniphilus sp.]MDY3901953.1 ABC transporter ATP-binding protein [Peptoniphilus sp.]